MRKKTNLLLFWTMATLFIIVLIGSLIFVPSKQEIRFKAPIESTIIEKTIIPKEVTTNVACKFPDYEVLSEEVVAVVGRKLILQNNQDTSWRFTVTGTFTFTNRTSLQVPREAIEQVKETTLIPASKSKTLTIMPTTDLTHYNTLEVEMVITPDEEECMINNVQFTQEKEVRRTKTEEKVFTINHTTQKNLWEFTFQKISLFIKKNQ